MIDKKNPFARKGHSPCDSETVDAKYPETTKLAI